MINDEEEWIEFMIKRAPELGWYLEYLGTRIIQKAEALHFELTGRNVQDSTISWYL